MSKWIKCDDRMPKDHETVLVAGLWGNTGPLYWMEVKTRIDNAWHEQEEGDEWEGYPPTHWMPLPKPPEPK